MITWCGATRDRDKNHRAAKKCFWRLKAREHCSCPRPKMPHFSSADFPQIGQLALKTLMESFYQPDTVIFSEPRVLPLEPPHHRRKENSLVLSPQIPFLAQIPWHCPVKGLKTPLSPWSDFITKPKQNKRKEKNTVLNFHITWHIMLYEPHYFLLHTHEGTVVKFLLWPNIKGRGVAELSM